MPASFLGCADLTSTPNRAARLGARCQRFGLSRLVATLLVALIYKDKRDIKPPGMKAIAATPKLP
jgi:hypothetical protein